jgi:hypothetical protein
LLVFLGDLMKTESPLFEVSNHHVVDCGKPPTFNGDTPDMYFGYFANEYGEQAIYFYDYNTGEAVARMGDCGWENAYRVIDGRIEGVIVNDAEATWIRACWLATGKNRAYTPSSNKKE